MKYVGKTKRIMRFWHADPRRFVTNQIEALATEHHFNSPGHSLSDLSITKLERVRSNHELYRKEWEKYFTRKFNTFYRYNR
jgi:hypothetical protein